MKKIFLFLILLASTIYFLQTKKDIIGTPFSHPSKRLTPSSSQDMPLMAITKIPPPTNPYSSDDIESLEHFERNFDDLSNSKIEELIDKSNHLIESMNLFKKANEGTLNQEDTNTLVREIRLQTAARKVLIERLLDKRAERS